MNNYIYGTCVVAVCCPINCVKFFPILRFSIPKSSMRHHLHPVVAGQLQKRLEKFVALTVTWRDMDTYCSCFISCRSRCEIAGYQDLYQSQCAWVIPSYTKAIDYSPIRKIDFTSASGKKRKLDKMIYESVNDSAEPTSNSCFKHRIPSTNEELSSYFIL